MRPLTAEELLFVQELISDCTATEEEVAQVLGEDAPVVVSLRGSRDYLRAVRDTGVLCGGGERWWEWRSEHG
jgi:hypothetical protein